MNHSLDLKGKLISPDNKPLSLGLLAVSVVLPADIHMLSEYSHEIDVDQSGALDEEFYAGIRIKQGRILGGRMLKAYKSLLGGRFKPGYILP